MKVDILHRNNLRVSTACRAALESEYRSKRWFSENRTGFLSDHRKPVCQTNRGRRLPFTSRCRCNGCHEDQLSIRFIFPIFQQPVVDLRFILSIEIQIFFIYVKFFRNLPDRLYFSSLSNLNIRFDHHDLPPSSSISAVLPLHLREDPVFPARLKPPHLTASSDPLAGTMQQTRPSARPECRTACTAVRKTSSRMSSPT